MVDGDLGGSKSRSGDELLYSWLVDCLRRPRRKVGNTYQLRVADQFPGEPEEGLLEVVVGLGGDIVVLEVLLAVEGDGLGLDLALLHIDLVATQHNGNVLADTDEIT